MNGTSLDNEARVLSISSLKAAKNAWNFGPEALPVTRKKLARDEQGRGKKTFTHELEQAGLAGRDPSTSLAHRRERNGNFFLVCARDTVCKYVHIIIFVQEVQDGLDHADMGLRGINTDDLEAPATLKSRVPQSQGSEQTRSCAP